MDENLCEKIVSNDKKGTLRFRVILKKVTDERYLRFYKFFNLEPKLYQIIQWSPFNPNNYEQKSFNVKNYLTVDFFDESNWEQITLCNELTPLLAYGIVHQYYINQVDPEFDVTYPPNFILWKYFGKLLSVRHIAKYAPEFLNCVKNNIVFSNRGFESMGMGEKLNIVVMENNLKDSYYLEDSEGIRMRDEYIANKMIEDFIIDGKTPDFNNYIKERQNFIY